MNSVTRLNKMKVATKENLNQITEIRWISDKNDRFFNTKMQFQNHQQVSSKIFLRW